jgi:hypothetical protein
MTRQREYSRRYAKSAGARLVRNARRDEVLEALSAAGPRAVYCGCLDFAIRSGSQKATGYAAHLFREIFGTWPRPYDRGPPAPLPNFLIDEWVALRKRNARPRNEAPKARAAE